MQGCLDDDEPWFAPTKTPRARMAALEKSIPAMEDSRWCKLSSLALAVLLLG